LVFHTKIKKKMEDIREQGVLENMDLRRREGRRLKKTA
jgi:hypothetical protein